MSVDVPATPLRRRLVLATAGLSLVVAVLLVVVVQAILEWTSGNSVDRVLRDRADVVVRSVTVRDGKAVVPDASLVPGVAVYDAQGALLAGSVPPSQRHEFDELAKEREVTFHQDADAYRLVARPFSLRSGGASGAGRTDGVVVVSESLGPYETQERNALLVCLAAGAVIVGLATGLASWASRRALAPVAQMARTAQEWGAHDLDRRFDLGPPTDEIRALGQTLDGLLDRVARAIADEQRLTSELAHELRTPLTAVQSTVDLIAMRQDLDPDLRGDVDELAVYCRAMGATITGLLDLARAHAGTVGSSSTLDDVLADVLRQVGSAGKVTIDAPTGVELGVPQEVAVRALVPVIDNATRYGDRVELSVAGDAASFVITVADDGPGVASALKGRLFEPGTTSGEGSGLGLALARRVARSVGGDVLLGEGRGSGGAAFEVRLPRGDTRRAADD